MDLLDSTEVYDPEANVWTVVDLGPFPVKVAGLRLINIMDKVLAFGKKLFKSPTNWKLG